MCARRDSNPQPSDLSPLEQLAAASASGCFECRELGCGGELACDCGCHDVVEQFDDLVDVGAFTLWCGVDHNRVTGCENCQECQGCSCYCHDDDFATTSATAWELAA